jgi:transposase
LIGDLDREIDATSREIDQRTTADPYVEVLCQIRGIGRYIAMPLIAEIGDLGRFPSTRHLCTWAGLTPAVRSSDGWGGLAGYGPGLAALRWALVEAAQRVRRTAARRLRADHKAPRQAIAKIAVTRKILSLCFYGLRDGEIRCLASRAKARAIRTVAVVP